MVDRGRGLRVGVVVDVMLPSGDFYDDAVTDGGIAPGWSSTGNSRKTLGAATPVLFLTNNTDPVVDRIASEDANAVVVHKEATVPSERVRRCSSNTGLRGRATADEGKNDEAP